MQSYLRIKPFWIYKTQDKTLKNQPTVWHYFTSTLTTHSAVKKVLFIHKHFDTTWSSQKTTSAGRTQWPNTYSIGLRTCCNTHIHCTSSKTKKSLEKKKRHILHYFAIQTLISLYRIQQYSQPSAHSAQAYGSSPEDSKHSYLYTPIYTHIHQYKHTHSDITTVTYPQ